MAAEYLSFEDAADIIATTMEYRVKGEMADNFTKHSPTLRHLTSNARPVDSGNLIVEHIMFDENRSAQWFHSYQQLDVTPNQTMRTAQFAWAEGGISTTISRRELNMNSGSSAVFSLIDQRTKNTDMTTREWMARQVWGDGTAYKGLALRGIPHVITDDGRGEVGGINSDDSRNTFWRNKVYSLGGSNEALSPASLPRYMSSIINNLTRNSERPTFIVTSVAIYDVFERGLQGFYRQTSSDSANLGYMDLYVKRIPLVFDNYCPSGRMYFINDKYLHLRPHRNANFKMVGNERRPYNQMVSLSLLHWMGQLTTTNRALQAVLKID